MNEQSSPYLERVSKCCRMPVVEVTLPGHYNIHYRRLASARWMYDVRRPNKAVYIVAETELEDAAEAEAEYRSELVRLRYEWRAEHPGGSVEIRGGALSIRGVTISGKQPARKLIEQRQEHCPVVVGRTKLLTTHLSRWVDAESGQTVRLPNPQDEIVRVEEVPWQGEVISEAVFDLDAGEWSLSVEDCAFDFGDAKERQ